MNRSKHILLGVGIAFAVYLGLLALLALLTVRGAIPESASGSLVRAAACAAAFAGAVAAARGESAPALVLAVCAAVFWCVVMLLGFGVNDGVDLTRAAGLLLPVCAGGALAYLPTGKRKKRGAGKRGRRGRRRG